MTDRQSWRSLGEICQVGGVKATSFGGVRPYYSTGAVGVKGFLAKPELIEFANRPSRANCMPPAGAVGFAKMKGTKKVIQISTDLDGAVFSTGFCFLVPGKEVLPEYLAYLLESDMFCDAKDSASGAGIMGGIKDSDVRELSVFAPSLSEQRRIVAALDKALAAIETEITNTEKSIANARELFGGELNRLFPSPGCTAMDSQQSICLADACSVFADGDWIEKKDQSPKGIRLIQTGNVGIGDFKNRLGKARYISSSTFKNLKCTEVREGDCLVSRLPDPVGRSCIVPAMNGRAITAVDCTIIRFKKIVLPEFFRYYSQSGAYLESVDKYCTGATRRRISRTNLGKILIPAPPVPVQKSLIAQIDKITATKQSFVACYERKRNALADLKKSLFAEYFPAN